MRLGDLDALKEVITSNHYLLSSRNNSIDYGMFTTGIIQAIDNAPSVEPKQGEWVFHTYMPQMNEKSEMNNVSNEEAGTKEINRFINHYEDENVATKYNAGIVCMKNGNYMVGYEMKGAEETFSVGQPVYDEDRNLMGYLGICMYDNLNYSTHGNVRIPVEYWMICLPTKYCVEGKKIYTYWQTNQKGGKEDGAE